MPTKKEIVLKYSGLLIAFIAVMFLSGQNGSSISCGLQSCCNEFNEYVDALHAFNQYLDYMLVEPSCGNIVDKNIQRIKIGFTAPVNPGTFSIGSKIISSGKDANGQSISGLAFYNPQFINDNRVIVLPIIPSSVTKDVTYRVTIRSSSDSPLIVGGEKIIGSAWIEFTVRERDSEPPYIVSLSPGLPASLTRSEYLSRPAKPIDAINVEPHIEVLVKFSERMNFINIVASREARIGVIPGLELIPVPYINPAEEINFLREDTATETVVKSQTVKGLLPGFQYAFDFVSCGSGCVINCASGTQDLSGWYLVPCLGSECSDLKVDDWRSFTTSKVRIDSPALNDKIKKHATNQSNLNVSGIITKDLSGSVTLSIEGSGVSSSVPIVATPSTQAYNSYIGSLNISGVSEGEYKLKATAPDGGTDSIGLVIDRTAPVVSIVSITPSYGQYVGANIYVEVNISESGSGISSVTINGQGTQKSPQGRYYTMLSLLNYASGSTITIRAEAKDYAGNIGVSTRTVIVDKDPPVLTNINISNTYYPGYGDKKYIRGNFTVTGNISDLAGAKVININTGRNWVNVTISGNTFRADITNQTGVIYVQIVAVDNLDHSTGYYDYLYGPYEVDNTPPVWPYFVWSSGIIEPGALLTVCGNILFYWEWLTDLNIYGTKVRINWYEPDLSYNTITYAYEPQFTDPEGKVVYKMTICVQNVILPEEIYAPGQNSLDFCTSDYVGNLNCNPFYSVWVYPTIDWLSQDYGKPGDLVTIMGWGYKWFNQYSGQDYITINGVEVLPEYIISVTENTIQFRVPSYVSSGELKVYVNDTASNSKLFTVCSNRNKFVKNNLYDGSGISMAVTPDDKPWITFKDDYGVYLSGLICPRILDRYNDAYLWFLWVNAPIFG
jgi:hypothetical protein